MAEDKKICLLVVAGPTASGKTSLAVSLAKTLNGEVVSADSMQIYKGMDIATAKPTLPEQDGVHHHMLDFLPPTATYSVKDYCKDAAACIEDIAARGKVPILAGGTGLYIDSLTQGLQFSPEESHEDLRAELEQKSGEELYEQLKQCDPQTAQRLHLNDRKRIIRALELYLATGVTMTRQLELSRMGGEPYDCCRILLNARERQVLYDRIDRRVDLMAQAGLVEEAKAFFASPHSATAKQAIGYKELAPYFAGEVSLEDALSSLKQATRRYAKRQLTWFRKEERYHTLYLDDYKDAHALCQGAMDYIKNFSE